MTSQKTHIDVVWQNNSYINQLFTVPTLGLARFTPWSRICSWSRQALVHIYTTVMKVLALCCLVLAVMYVDARPGRRSPPTGSSPLPTGSNPPPTGSSPSPDGDGKVKVSLCILWLPGCAWSYYDVACKYLSKGWLLRSKIMQSSKVHMYCNNRCTWGIFDLQFIIILLKISCIVSHTISLFCISVLIYGRLLCLMLIRARLLLLIMY